MKTLRFILLPFLFVMIACNGQTKKEPEQLLSIKAPDRNPDDSASKPDIRYKVDKKYDDKGNMISYDSTYTYSYSGPGGKGFSLTSEDVFRDFNSRFGDPSFNIFNSPGSNLFSKDSTFIDLFNTDFFRQHMEMNQKIMDDFFQHLRSTPEQGIRKKKAEHTADKTI
jgi:hypothetical protein